MKKIIEIASCILALLWGASCNDEINTFERGNSRTPTGRNDNMMKRVTLKMKGDYVSESEELLLRSDDGDIYMGINVYRTQKLDGATEERYAYGVFENADDLEINLSTGYTYRFEASILVEKEDRILKTTQNLAEPFQWLTDNSSGYPADYPSSKIGKLQYTYDLTDGDKLAGNGQRPYLSQLKTGTASVTTSDRTSKLQGAMSYPRVKRFYGNVAGYDPEGTQENDVPDIEIPMSYKCFGLKIILENLPSGNLTVRDNAQKNLTLKPALERLVFPENLSLSESNKEWEGVYSMNKLGAESEDFTLLFSWDKGGGTPETFTKTVTVHPKKMKVLKVNVTGSPNYGTKGNIVFNIENEDLTAEEEMLTWDAK